MEKVCPHCQRKLPLSRFPYRNKKYELKRMGRCLDCKRILASRWFKAKRLLRRSTATLASLSDDAWADYFNEFQSIQAMRRVLQLPLLTLDVQPCLRCGASVRAEMKQKRRLTWHCRSCLKFISDHDQGLPEQRLGYSNVSQSFAFPEH